MHVLEIIGGFILLILSWMGASYFRGGVMAKVWRKP